MRAICAASLLLTAAVASALPAADAPAAERLHALFAREWEERLRENPLLATAVGRHEWNDRLPSVAADDEARRADAARRHLDELATIDAGALDAGDRVSRAIFERQLQDRLTEHEHRTFEVPINADSGFHIGFSRLPDRVPLDDSADYENYIARLRAAPAYFAQQIDNMRAGLERGMMVPRVVLEGYERTIAAHVVEDPESSVFWAPFADFPVGVPAGDRERLAEAGRRAVAEGVVPAYRAFLDFMVGTYIPGARQTIAAADLPRGDDYYRYLVRHFTTLDVTPREVHEIGLAEVARIRAEMEAVIEETGFEGDFAAFQEHLRTDPRFYPESAEALLREASWIAKRMDAKLPSLFKTLPRLPYGVAPVPEHIAPKYTAGRYVGAPLGSTQPGYYWVNTYALDSRPLFNLEALTLHEAVPGHHLQNALSQELEDLPPFRRFSYISAFGEGWGLYSEWLGIEAGFYQDPYSEFGRLSYEMWRACRLVVDTGLHAFGWPRQRAIDYLASNTALPLHEVRTETDRYISWPGQALAYKMGELEIRKLRRRAEEALAERFDVRAFHDAVLLDGAVPLPVLAERIERFIRDSAGTGTASPQ